MMIDFTYVSTLLKPIEYNSGRQHQTSLCLIASFKPVTANQSQHAHMCDRYGGDKQKVVNLAVSFISHSFVPVN